MKKLIVLILLGFALPGFGQVYQLMPQYGYDAKRMKFDSTLQIPTVCGTPTLKSNVLKYAAIAYDSCNKRFYYYDPKLAAWDTIKGGGGSSIDTSSLSNRINNKVDSIKRSNDSVYFKKNGIWYFSFRDSVHNGRWGNDTALVILAKVRNATGSQLNAGEVVYISGASGDVATVKRANNKFDSTSATTIGMVKDNIAIGDTGWVVTQGQISKINTAAFTAGDIIYLDSIDGQFTKTKQMAPYHLVFIGVVERSNAGNGTIYIKPQNGYELNELHDVKITSPINNQILVYSDTQQLWKNMNVYSVVDTTGLSNRINAKLSKSDSTIYQTKYGTDTLRTNIYSALDTKVYNITVDPPLAQSAATGDVNITIPIANAVQDGYLSATDYISFGNKVNISDTANMLKNYQRTSSFPMFVFGAGSGVAADTSAFLTSTIYGAFYNDGVDTIIITGYRAIVQGTSASVTPTIYWNDTLSTTVATKAVNSPSAVTSTTTGNNVTSLDNTKIAPGNWVWVQTGTVTTKPTFFSLTLFGYRKR